MLDKIKIKKDLKVKENMNGKLLTRNKIKNSSSYSQTKVIACFVTTLNTLEYSVSIHQVS